MTTQRRDITALGAHCMPTRELLKLAGVDPNELAAAEQALALVGAARDERVRALRSGPRLAAALELGRRAWMLPSPAGRRVRAPVDVSALCAPRFADAGMRCCSIALDRRLTVARVDATATTPSEILRGVLAAGTTRAVVALNRSGMRAVPTNEDATLKEKLLVAFATVDVRLLDIVLLGDDGFCSLLRLGMLKASDPRYR